MTTSAARVAAAARDQMNIVIVGHVDHGKSTVIGRLLADTGSLPEGKLEQVKAMCARNARPFEYAFLLDALKNEQAQGITIDTARSFFKSKKRDYIINDAPGHIEFLKNMVTGAARAEAALLVIDAHEGVQENSRRHGYIVSMLGIKQVAVLVNKMDLEDYSEARFHAIRDEYVAFLTRLGVHPEAFIPISAREGINLVTRAPETPWYKGRSVLEQVDAFEKVHRDKNETFRMPVQDIYKFTAQGDARRIVAGMIETGFITPGTEVVFQPSGKKSVIKSIEGFNTPPLTEIGRGHSTGFTLTTQIYIKPGELMCKADEPPPKVSRRFRANLFWMGRSPMIMNRQYKMKIGASSVLIELADILNIIDASELSSVAGKRQIDRHDVAECIVDATRPIAFDRSPDIEQTGRFVIVDDFEITGCGNILEELDDSQSVMEEHVRRRELVWEKGHVTPEDRRARFQHEGVLLLFHGPKGCGKRRVSRLVEKGLFENGANTYYFGIANLFEDLDHDARTHSVDREENLQRLAELGRVITDAGLLFFTTITDLDDFDLENLKTLIAPNRLFVVNLGESEFDKYPIDVQLPFKPDYDEAAQKVVDTLREKGVVGSNT
jgi:bifunctional enzyme CysN/CysC